MFCSDLVMHLLFDQGHFSGFASVFGDFRVVCGILVLLQVFQMFFAMVFNDCWLHHGFSPKPAQTWCPFRLQEIPSVGVSDKRRVKQTRPRGNSVDDGVLEQLH